MLRARRLCAYKFRLPGVDDFERALRGCFRPDLKTRHIVRKTLFQRKILTLWDFTGRTKILLFTGFFLSLQAHLGPFVNVHVCQNTSMPVWGMLLLGFLSSYVHVRTTTATYTATDTMAETRFVGLIAATVAGTLKCQPSSATNGGYSQNVAGRVLRGTFAHGSMLDVWLVACGREKLTFGELLFAPFV